MNDSKLRASLIRLAHSKPELRAEILPLLTNKTAAGPDRDQAEKLADAINALLDSADIDVYLKVGESSRSVRIPNGFSSLFDSLKIVVRWSKSAGNLYGEVGWEYTHPTGGSNGIKIGVVNFDGIIGSWRNAVSGDQGEV